MSSGREVRVWSILKAAVWGPAGISLKEWGLEGGTPSRGQVSGGLRSG